MKALIQSYLFKPDPQRRDFYAGMAMATPFVAAMIPYPWMFSALITSVPLIIHLALWGIRLPQHRSIPMFVWFVILIGVIHIYGLWSGTTPYWLRTLADIGVAAAGVFVFLTRLKRPGGSGDMFNGFIAALIPFAITAAILGLIKAAMLKRGLLLGFIYERYHDLYPSGASLKDDYNMFSLSLLIAGLGLVMNCLQEDKSRTRIIYNLLGLVVIVSAGMLTPSRRFAIVSTLIPGLWLTVGAFTIPRAEWARKIMLPMAGVACAVFLICMAIESPNQISDYQVVHLWSTSDTVSADSIVDIGPAKDRLIETFQEKHSYGFASRIDKFLVGRELLMERAWLTGIGFSYHEVFSCRFADCASLDYPHFPLLSEWLIGGVIGAFTAMAIYFLLLHTLWRLGRHGWMSGITAMALAVLSYSLLSGDTLFSMPQFIILCLLVQNEASCSGGA